MDDNEVGLSLWDQWRLYREFAPLLQYGERIIDEKDSYKQVLLVADACEWLAAKSQTKTDDAVVDLLAGVLRTEAGQKLVRWVIEKAKDAK